ncbi:MAG: hypothetical protein ABIH36_02450 [bacterium]
MRLALVCGLPKDGYWGPNTYNGDRFVGSIGDINIGVCCSDNHIEDDDGIPVSSLCGLGKTYHLFAYRGEELLWMRMMYRHSASIEGDRIKLVHAFHRFEPGNPEYRSYYLDPKTGEKISDLSLVKH